MTAKDRRAMTNFIPLVLVCYQTVVKVKGLPLGAQDIALRTGAAGFEGRRDEELGVFMV